MHFSVSSVEAFQLRGRTFYVKRDDLIDPRFSGNKFRKLYVLFDLPDERYLRLISWGGNQSNAMLSMAALCAEKGWRFEYFTKHIPPRIRAYPTGNLRAALDFGMVLNEVEAVDYPQAVAACREEPDEYTLVLAQGGADAMAREGIAQLAAEIRDWQVGAGIEKLHVVTPSGTGTTVAFLAALLPECTVLTTPAVADIADLHRQIELLMPVPANLRILDHDSRFRFARPDPALLAMYDELKQAGIEFDLIYGCLMWHTLLAHSEKLAGDVLYVHSGGLAGNETMLDRYRYKGLC